MKLARLLLQIPFKFNTIDFKERWEGRIPGMLAEDVGKLQKKYPIKATNRWVNKIPFLFSVVQNISVLKSCAFYKPTIIPNLEKGIGYIRIHKSGSSSIVSALSPSHSNHKRSLEAVEWTAYYYYQQGIPLAERDLKYFTVVRNPFARLVSAYLNSYFEGDSFHYVYDCYFFGLFQQKHSFSEFVERIFIIPEPLLLDHIKPQTTVLRNLKINKIKVFKLEQDGQKITQFLGLKEGEFSKLNVTSSYDYKAFYDLKSFERASKVYKNDIEFYGYQKEYEELKNHVSK
jgi:hypothetical protein